MQVWWAVSTPVAQFLEVYNLASGRTTKVTMRNELSPVTVMRLGERGLLWVGHQKGELKVWSEASQLPLCPPLQLFDCEVRCAFLPSLTLIAGIRSIVTAHLCPLTHTHACTGGTYAVGLCCVFNGARSTVAYPGMCRANAVDVEGE